jgi:hypothetical protein
MTAWNRFRTSNAIWWTVFALMIANIAASVAICTIPALSAARSQAPLFWASSVYYLVGLWTWKNVRRR